MTSQYKVIDNQTGYAIATCTSLKAARRKADKLDMQYGAIRYGVKIVEVR